MPYARVTPSSPLISYSVEGRGDRSSAVLFLAGMGMSRDAWSAQVAHFSRTHLLILPDNRHSGHSALCSPSEVNLSAMAEDAWAVVNAAIGPGARVHIVGHSMGAMIAQKAAAAFPERVRSLALLASHAGGWWWSNIPSSGLIAATLNAALRGFSEEALVDVTLSLHYSEPFLCEYIVDDSGWKRPRRDALRERYMNGSKRERARDPDGQTFWAQLAAVRQHELRREEEEAIRWGKFETVVIYGENDEVVPPRASCELAGRVHAGIVRVAGRHFVADEARHDVNYVLQHLFESDACKSFAPQCTSWPADPGVCESSELLVLAEIL